MSEQRPRTSPLEKGEIQAIIYGNTVITVKDKCSCGGSVHVTENPDGPGKIATCQRCGATLRWGGDR